MPPVPPETKYHPSAVDLLLIKRLIAETSKQNLLQFLQHEFVNIGKPYAERLIEAGVSVGGKDVKQVYIPDATGAIYDVLKEMALSHASKKKRYQDEDADLLKKVSARLITKTHWQKSLLNMLNR
ncbi:DNA topoisomerase 6 subunit B [Camellia lanceoleosa]|uniref:DNA topoisomerase 6 subunit B n=1 Tax=Camellia lanceoleosa TaxID=1840588 RepID=A0ACC0FXC4_9ERIC|nr:DNA topoisomerase 6 subunit B [Camellia lanceoleosa]